MRIIENAASNFEQLQARLMEPAFPWCFAPSEGSDANPWLYAWTHRVFDDGRWFSAQAQVIRDAMASALDDVGEPINDVFRIQASLHTLSDQPYLDGPVVDLTLPHKTALLFVNDADGEVRVHAERWRPGPPPTGLTVEHTVAAVANRLALFEGLRYRAAAMPTRTPRRIVIAMNYA